jgi:hypothetical protein
MEQNMTSIPAAAVDAANGAYGNTYYAYWRDIGNGCEAAAQSIAMTAALVAALPHLARPAVDPLAEHEANVKRWIGNLEEETRQRVLNTPLVDVNPSIPEPARPQIAAMRPVDQPSNVLEQVLAAERDEARRERDAYLQAFNGADRWAAERNSTVETLTAERDALAAGYVRISQALGGTDEWSDLNTMVAQVSQAVDALAARLIADLERRIVEDRS